jgi:hypothetical protein
MATEPPKSNENENLQQTTSAQSAAQQQRTYLLQNLEISQYELGFLERYLLTAGWVPASTTEAAIDEAVYNFRADRSSIERYDFPQNVWRLNTLFDAYIDDEDGWKMSDVGNWRETFVCDLQRETAKYDAVRTIFADLATSESRKRGAGGQAS